MAVGEGDVGLVLVLHVDYIRTYLPVAGGDTAGPNTYIHHTMMRGDLNTSMI